jgi:hypothetical protein
MTTITINENKVNGIIKHLSDKNSVANFLRNHKIGDVESILDIREYDTYCDRKGLIFDIKENNATDKYKVMIDVKSGQPSVEQVYDAIYTIGADCTKRVLIFTGGRDYGDRDYLGANLEVVKNLLSEINSNGTALYLVTAISITNDEFYIYDLIDAPCDDLGDDADPLPSQIEFLEEEFWQLFYIPLDGISGNEWEPFLDGFINYNGIGSHENLGYVDAKLTWSESGLFFHVADNGLAQGDLKDIWNNKAHILKRLFNGCKMIFNDQSDNRSELSIQIWDLPISYLVGADRREKEFCAKFMKVSFSKLVMFFEYGIPDS